jgi:hypothetical protein
MFSKLAVFFTALVAVLAAYTVDAQATILTSPGSGLTSAVVGTPVALSQFNAANGWGMFAPFAYSAADIAATSGDMVLIHKNDQTPMAFQWNIIWNFTTSESTTIRTWLSGLSARNNIVVSFTATWYDDGRFPVDTSSWTFAQQSLMPYGMTDACNVSALVAGNRLTLTLLPAPCTTVLVPSQKQGAISAPQCLMYFGKTALEVYTACQTVRSFLETVYCTDGSSGVDTVCNYNQNFLPSGVAGPVIITVNADGTPGVATPAPGKGSAGAISSFMMAVAALVAVFAF